MEQTIPIEECARQRLQVMVWAYTMFTKNLMEEGVERDKVKNASDKVWAAPGEQAAGQGFSPVRRPNFMKRGYRPIYLSPSDGLIAFVPQTPLNKFFKDRIRFAGI